MQIIKYLLLSLAVGVNLWAYDDRPACFKELEQHFFRYEAVGQALSMHQIDQSQWSPLIRQVLERQIEAASIIKSKARRMHPNPLENPFQPDVARDLLHETMYQIFERAVLESGYFDVYTIHAMFDFIWSQDPRIKHCFPVKK